LVSPQLFLETVRAAAKAAGTKIRQVTYQAQSPDHPIAWGLENTHYLKFLIIEVSD
jgi:23S rRNA (cytosine1962-C5)-methyltransferase